MLDQFRQYIYQPKLQPLTSNITLPSINSSLSHLATATTSGNRKPLPSSVRFRPLSITASAERTRSFNTCLSAPNMASFSLYEVLGIPMGASGLEIKAAYRRMARTCHPDVVTIGQKDSSADEFMKIHAAYSTLSDPEKRAEYDRRIFRLHRSTSSAVSASLEPVLSRFNSGYTCRNWETDQCW